MSLTPIVAMEMSRITILALMVFAAEASVHDHDREALLHADQGGPSSKGSDFYVAFPDNADTLADSVPLYQLLVTTDEPEPVTFTVSLNESLPEEMREGFPLTDTVSYGEVVTVTLHQEMAVLRQAAGRNHIERSKAIHIQTEGGKRISVQGFSDDLRTSDGFVALPCDAMRNDIFNRFEYFALTADQIPADDMANMKTSQIVIVPCDDVTDIRVEPSQVVTLNELGDLRRPPDVIQAGPEAFYTSISFTADAGQTILISSEDELSGTIIQGSKPLVVLSGHECAKIPVDVNACDHLVEQMPPGMTFGYTFFLVPLAGRVSGDMFRVGTLTDGTEVTITCTSSLHEDPVKIPLDRDGAIDRGGYITFWTPRNENNGQSWKPSYCCVDSTEPVIVAQYSAGYAYDQGLTGKPNSDIGDPFMIVIPPVSQFLNNYTVRTLSGVSGHFPYQYTNLAISSTFFNNSFEARNQVKFNDSSVTPIDGWIPFYCSDNEVCGYGAQVQVSSGTLRVYHEQPDAGLGVSYYAYQEQNSYGVSLGHELSPISATRAILHNITVLEDAGTVRISIPRFGDLSLRSEVILTPRPTSPEEASVGTDYADFSINLVYRGGSKQDNMTVFEITIIDDNVEEPTESFEIVGVPTKNLYFPIPVLTVTILDTHEPPKVWFHPTSYTVKEDADGVVLTIMTNYIDAGVNGVVVFYTEENGTASATDDYNAVPQNATIPVIFAAGQLSTTVFMHIINDNSVESDESFIGRLKSKNLELVTVTQDRAEIVIRDDDLPEAATVFLSPTSYEVDESAGSVNISVAKTGIFSKLIRGRVTVLATSSAHASTDFTGGAYPFMIEPTEEHTVVPIPIIDDTTVEQPQEQFFVSLSLQPMSGVTLGISEATVTIMDNDYAISCPSYNTSHGNFNAEGEENDRPISGTVITLSCDDGYAPEGGHNTATCNENGQWEPVVPKCGVTIKENGNNPIRLSPIIGGAVGALVLLIAVVIAIVALLLYARKDK